MRLLNKTKVTLTLAVGRRAQACLAPEPMPLYLWDALSSPHLSHPTSQKTLDKASPIFRAGLAYNAEVRNNLGCFLPLPLRSIPLSPLFY